jgi:hypothetical protein
MTTNSKKMKAKKQHKRKLYSFIVEGKYRPNLEFILVYS